MPKTADAISGKPLFGQIHTWRRANTGGISQRIKLFIMGNFLVKPCLNLDIVLNFPVM